MEFGLSFGALYAPAAEIARLGRDVERGGFDACWVPDSQMLYRDPYAVAALLAGETTRCRVGTLATNPVTRHPAVTANAALTIQEVSGGRGILGIATGDSAVRRVGTRPVGVSDLEGAVIEMRALLAGKAVAYPGGEFAIRFASIPPPPIYVVGTGFRVLELAGRVADGVVLNVGVDPAVLRIALEHVDAGARAAGRDPATIARVAFAFCTVDAELEVARARLKPSVSWFCLRFPGLCELVGLPLDPALRETLARFQADYARYDLVHATAWTQAMEDAAVLPPAYVDRFALAGPPARLVEQIRDLGRLGLARILIRPPSHADWWPTVRAFMEHVIPACR